MGSIRLLLALAVALFHSYGLTSAHDTMTGGAASVQAFYIISGFYMAMILAEKYKPGKGSYRLFITNRFLRIFPPYWACLAVVLLVCLVGNFFFDEPFYLWYWLKNGENLHWTTIAVFIFANLFLFGSDALLFSGVDRSSGQLEFTHNMYAYSPRAFQYLLIPQIWSVGVELCFYLLAPLLLRAKWFWQLGVVALSLGVRYYVIEVQDWHNDPWTYRFFPAELAFFMAGSLAFRFYAWIKDKDVKKFIAVTLWLLVVAAIVSYPRYTFVPEPHRRWYFYGLFLLALPFIFRLTKNNRVDRRLGELSFPVYICHHFIMFLWRKFFFTHTAYMEWFGIVTALSSLLFAILLWRTVIVPLEKYRQLRVKN